MLFESSKTLLIKYLQEQLEKKPETCTACSSKESIIKYLQEQIEKFRNEWRVERSEYKRTVDRLLEKTGSQPVGQGSEAALGDNKPLDVNDLAGMFNEPEEVKR